MEGGWSTVAGEGHSSGDAELEALEQAVVRSLPPVHYITDSMLIVRGVRMGVAWTTRITELHADVWRRIWEAVKEWPIGSLSASHVKAHRPERVLGPLDEEQQGWCMAIGW